MESSISIIIVIEFSIILIFMYVNNTYVNNSLCYFIDLIHDNPLTPLGIIMILKFIAWISNLSTNVGHIFPIFFIEDHF